MTRAAVDLTGLSEVAAYLLSAQYGASVLRLSNDPGYVGIALTEGLAAVCVPDLFSALAPLKTRLAHRTGLLGVWRWRRLLLNEGIERLYTSESLLRPPTSAHIGAAICGVPRIDRYSIQGRDQRRTLL